MQISTGWGAAQEIAAEIVAILPSSHSIITCISSITSTRWRARLLSLDVVSVTNGKCDLATSIESIKKSLSLTAYEECSRLKLIKNT